MSALADAIGLSYGYNEAREEWVHPAVLAVLVSPPVAHSAAVFPGGQSPVAPLVVDGAATALDANATITASIMAAVIVVARICGATRFARIAGLLFGRRGDERLDDEPRDRVRG